MVKRMLIDGLHLDEMRVAITDDRQILDFDFTTTAKKQIKGNVYLAKITRVEPSLQAAFVEYGGGKQGFLPFSEIHPDYYRIPISDRQRLIEEAEAAAAEDDDEDETSTAAAGGQESAATASEEEESGEPLAEAGAWPLDMLAPGVDESLAEPEAPSEASSMAENAYTPSVSQEAPEEQAHAENTVAEVGPAEGESRNEIRGDAPTEATENGSEGEKVETISSREDEISGKRKRAPFFKRYRIQEVIKSGQIVLVQVIKEERGNKGVSLTTYLSLAGRYCVLMPNSPRDGGVSRKISDSDTRRRLKDVMAELKLVRGMSVIIRTAGIDRTRAEIRRDFDYLVKLWNQIRETTLNSTAPALIYEESDIIKRAIRDQYTSDIDEVLVEGEDAYQSAREFMAMLLPSHTPRVRHYQAATPLFYSYGIEDQLMSMHDPVVKLRSGGYIVLAPTEALISIDVNSGRATSERNIEETATKTNLEAAAEIARQLRLRDLAGLVVIDFIDMMESRNRRNVERALKDALKADRAKIQLGRISPFGLLEMSRQRLRPSISEASTVACPHCQGRGVLRSNDSMSLQIVRSLEKEAASNAWQTLKVNAAESVALYLLNHKRELITMIEERYKVQIIVQIDSAKAISDFAVEKIRRNSNDRQSEQRNRNERNRVRQEAPMDVDAVVAASLEAESREEAENSDGTGSRNGRSRRGRRGGRKRNFREQGERPATAEGVGNSELTADEAAHETPESNSEPVEGSEENSASDRKDRPRRRGERGGRGRRRWKERDERSNSSNTEESTEPHHREPETAEQQEERVVQIHSYSPRAQDQGSTQAFAAAPASNTERPPTEPARKGWWQRIIELD